MLGHVTLAGAEDRQPGAVDYHGNWPSGLAQGGGQGGGGTTRQRRMVGNVDGQAEQRRHRAQQPLPSATTGARTPAATLPQAQWRCPNNGETGPAGCSSQDATL
jgi:hypothetical protein